MVLRLLYRLLIIIPVTLSILLITLFLFYQLPGVHVFDSERIELGSDRELERILWEQQEQNPFIQARGLFYVGVDAGYVPDSLYLIPYMFRSPFKELSKEVQNPKIMNDYAIWIRNEIQNLRYSRTAKLTSRQLFQVLRASSVLDFAEKIESRDIDKSQYPPEWTQIIESKPAKNQPVIHVSWNGDQNLFHFYLKALLTGKPELHTLSGERIKHKFKRTLRWTLSYSIPVLLISWMVVFVFILWNYDRTRILAGLDRGIVLLYSFPTFVLATLALVFFTSHRYGMISRLFPFPVYLETNVNDLWDIYKIYGRHLILPMLLFAISPMILFYRVFYEKIREIKVAQPSYRYLRHVGLSDKAFRFRYLSRYLLVATWAVLSNLFVAVLGGSLIIEWIFNIPGLGRYVYESIVNYDIGSTVYLIFVFTIVQQTGHVLSDFMIEYFFSADRSSAGYL